MKRRDLEKHLRQHGCVLHHHGGNHDVWINTATLKRTSVPRHGEIRTGLAKRICKQLDVPPPE